MENKRGEILKLPRMSKIPDGILAGIISGIIVGLFREETPCEICRARGPLRHFLCSNLADYPRDCR